MPIESEPLLNVERVRGALAGTSFADVRYVRETGSTNDDAAALLGDPAAAGRTLVAEFQTAGKGRKAGRAWIAPAGSALLFTAVLPQAVPASALWAVPFWTALAVADGVEEGSGVRLDLRWPNDCDLRGRKVAGILCVSRIVGATAWVGCGVGINLRRPDDPAVAAIEPAPAYLSDAAPDVERETVLAAILGAMDGLLDVLERPDDAAGAWEERAALRGTRYRLRLDADGSEIDGAAQSLDREGGLVVATAHGIRTVHLGDARVIPPSP
ncbi:biotin--[acetyl-CoA-carboxylase] ligase [Vulcanimicrobium alpinum]|uniref:Biotin--[acetyl-CoA-carboxylase] ligase n=1 Tax=Vulcanimicrobium alpinum TaxID=3016050 RepID=A0AAN1XYL2_UNVUL|nr:biotin--[acetyl-CoA-carboxylase] ligase [Vulcanimicrobium alpinum]BDE07787.1 biotin--[acetyl-CoA-carboxylase] ligase [Vulcanimicrobium alpinum]